MIRRLGMPQERELGRMMFQDPDQSYLCWPIKGQNPIINACTMMRGCCTHGRIRSFCRIAYRRLLFNTT
jgi:hypothetical protein